MKHLKSLYSLILLTLLTMLSCQEDDPSLGPIIAPSNLQVSYEIEGQDADNPYGDGSGIVYFHASADNAITYKFTVDGKDYVTTSGNATARVSITGINTYIVNVIAYGTGGVSTSTSLEIEVYSAFNDAEAKSFLTGAPLTTDEEGNTVLDLEEGIPYSKTWYWAANLPLHVGLGPVEDDYGNGEFAYESWWSAIQPFDDEKSCMYTSKFVFTVNIDGSMTFEQTEGMAYVPGAYAGVLGIDGELCYDATTIPNLVGLKNVSFFPSSSKAALEGSYSEQPYRGTSFEIDDGFMSWFVGSGIYDIISIDSDFLRVRVIQDGSIYGDGGYAWYQLLSSTDPYEVDNTFESNYTNLVWADEFDTNGAPDAANWTYDLGAGGWGNQEEQTYTSDVANVIVEDGMLKITAINTGSGYTSARIKTQGLFDFTYGRVEARAKLPASEGTWPAIWALGSNFETVGWPDCGEIDIMEHAGNNLNTIHGTLHYPGSSGGNADGGTTTVDTATTDFHLYTVEWSPDEILFVVDDTVVFHTFTNNNTTPFNNDFFLIINMAMGGTFGGAIDPAFTQETLEVDYIRVFQ